MQRASTRDLAKWSEVTTVPAAAGHSRSELRAFLPPSIRLRETSARPLRNRTWASVSRIQRDRSRPTPTAVSSPSFLPELQYQIPPSSLSETAPAGHPIRCLECRSISQFSLVALLQERWGVRSDSSSTVCGAKSLQLINSVCGDDLMRENVVSRSWAYICGLPL